SRTAPVASRTSRTFATWKPCWRCSRISACTASGPGRTPSPSIRARPSPASSTPRCAPRFAPRSSWPARCSPGSAGSVCRLPPACGAQIEGIGTNTRTVQGGAGRSLSAPATPQAVGPDTIEIGSFIGLAAVTNGAITIEGVRADDLRATLVAFERLGIHPRLDGTTLVVDAGQERRIRPDLGGHVPKLEDGPWPAFPADLMSIAIVV